MRFESLATIRLLKPSESKRFESLILINFLLPGVKCRGTVRAPWAEMESRRVHTRVLQVDRHKTLNES